MPIAVKRTSTRFAAFILAILLFLGCVSKALIAKPVHAEYHQAYIQTTIDTSIWEILAAAIDSSTSFFGTPMEFQRLGSILPNLADENNDYPSEVSDYIDDEYSSVSSMVTANYNNLVMTFPGDAYSDSTFLHTGSDSDDTARATLVRNSLIYDLNAAFKFVYGQDYKPAGSTKDDMVVNYRSDMQTFLNCISGSSGSITKNGKTSYFYFDGDAEFGNGPGARVYPDEVTNNSDYVLIKQGSESQYFLFRMPKGYVDISGRTDQGQTIPGVLGITQVDADKDTAYIHWGHFAVEAFINYNADEKVRVTADNVYSATPSALEKAFAGVIGSLCDWLAGVLGLWSFDELIFNSGTRGTSAYVGGIFPTTWQSLIWTFFFICELAAIAILLYAIIFNIGRRAIATMNPIVRANAIDQIQYLFLVAIALGLLPIILQLLINISFNLTGIFSDALGDTSAADRFKSLASNSGSLGAALTYLIYLGAIVYFNIFYGIRAVSIALLIITGPIFIAMMGVSENKRQLTIAWAKELVANLFIQPLQALMLCFIVMVPATGRNIDTIVMAYAMIPLTSLIRGLFFGESGGLIHQLAERGKQRTMHTAGNVARKAGSVAVGAVGGAAVGGLAAYNAAKNGNGVEVLKNAQGETPGGKGGTGPTSSNSKSTGSSQSSPSSTSSGGSPSGDGDVSSGALAGTTTEQGPSAGNAGPSNDVSDKVKQSVTAGNPTDNQPQDAGYRTDTGKNGHALAKAVALGALGGALHNINRRTFGIQGPNGVNAVTQLSRRYAAKSYSETHPQPQAQPQTETRQTPTIESPIQHAPVTLNHEGTDLGRDFVNGEEVQRQKFSSSSLAEMGIQNVESFPDVGTISFNASGNSVQAMELGAYADYLESLPIEQRQAEVESRGIYASRIADGSVAANINTKMWSNANNGASIMVGQDGSMMVTSKVSGPAPSFVGPANNTQPPVVSPHSTPEIVYPTDTSTTTTYRTIQQENPSMPAAQAYTKAQAMTDYSSYQEIRQANPNMSANEVLTQIRASRPVQQPVIQAETLAPAQQIIVNQMESAGQVQKMENGNYQIVNPEVIQTLQTPTSFQSIMSGTTQSAQHEPQVRRHVERAAQPAPSRPNASSPKSDFRPNNNKAQRQEP